MTRLKELRMNKGYDIVKGVKYKITQQYIADKIGCDIKTYRDYENGKRNITQVELLISLADFYKVSTDYILGRTDYTSVDNEMISNEIGLNDNAINTLKAELDYNQSNKSKKHSIDTINFILENHTDFSIGLLLENIYNYLFANYNQVIAYNNKEGTAEVCDKLVLCDNNSNQDISTLLSVQQLDSVFLTSITTALSVAKYQATNKAKQKQYTDYIQSNYSKKKKA